MRKKFYEATGATQARLSRAMDKRFIAKVTRQHDFVSPHPERPASAPGNRTGAFNGDGRTPAAPSSPKPPQQPGRGR